MSKSNFNLQKTLLRVRAPLGDSKDSQCLAVQCSAAPAGEGEGAAGERAFLISAKEHGAGRAAGNKGVVVVGTDFQDFQRQGFSAPRRASDPFDLPGTNLRFAGP